jgi:adenylosuccinate synthase
MPFSLDQPLEAVYEDLPGWGDTQGNHVPASLEAYIRRIEEAVGVPVRLVSLGPDRDQTVQRGRTVNA